MIELYTYGTANGQRASVMLELCGLPYRARKVDLRAGEQKRPEFLAVNPSGTIPVIVDPEGPDGGPLALAQSGAIVLYLAEKTGRLLPQGEAAAVQALRWFMAVMTDIAQASSALAWAARAEPALGEPVTAHLEGRFLAMAGDLDRRLAGAPYLAGGELSIADVALYPTVATRKALVERAGNLDHLRRWADAMAALPEVQRGMAVPG